MIRRRRATKNLDPIRFHTITLISRTRINQNHHVFDYKASTGRNFKPISNWKKRNYLPRFRRGRGKLKRIGAASLVRDWKASQVQAAEINGRFDHLSSDLCIWLLTVNKDSENGEYEEIILVSWCREEKERVSWCRSLCFFFFSWVLGEGIYKWGK